MAHLPTRAGTLFVSLICGALMALPRVSGAQDSPVTPSPSPAVSGASPDGNSPEVIEVDAPRLLKADDYPRTNGSLQKISLEGPVRYNDLNLRTDGGVAELRTRISTEAADICAHLAQIYPVYQAAGASCVKSAVDDANIRANRVIRRIRQTSY